MKEKVKTIIIMFAAYFILAIPFKVMNVIPGFTDVRPVTMFGPIYALAFGIPGCAVFAICNLIMDIISDSLRWSSIAGLLSNFAGPYLIFYYYKRISREGLKLKKAAKIFEYMVILILAALIEAIMITPSVRYAYPDVDWKVFMISVILNTSIFPIIFGIPLIILLQEELGFKMKAIRQDT